jgi:hypothetical protein
LKGARLALAVTLLVSAAPAPACDRFRHQDPEENWDPVPPPPVNLPAAVAARKASATPHPRILFTAETVQRIRASAKARSPLWRQVEYRCQLFRDGKEQGSGYLGLQWADAIATLSTCWFATGDKRDRDRAIFYLRAMLNDQSRVGDEKGGEKVVRANSGYPIRAYGVYAALAYDWLHDEPGMDELRPLIVKRLDEWLDWYAEDGYLRDSPYSNYFWGYYASLAMAGIATDGEADEAADWLSKSLSILEGKIIPGFHARLRGGEWAEGWQYGQLVAMEVGLLVDALHTATGADYSVRLPWLGEIIDAYLHRMHPDRTSVYGNGTQAERPPPPDPSGLYGALLVLRWANPDAAAKARFLIRRLSPEHHNERLWFAFAVDEPAGVEKDPRSPTVLSYHLPGPGQTFMRSSWKENAVWVAFQAGPRVAIDHEHNDQGHFEIWRGHDALAGDFADEAGYATINHNSILIDDRGEVLRYVPSQGVYGRRSRTIRWNDSGAAVVAVGDLTDNWDPKCVMRGCSQRAVSKVIRTLVYVRPNVVVTDDVVDVTKGSYGATWVAHVRPHPEVVGTRASAVVGGSRLDVHSLSEGVLRAVEEPTPTIEDDHIYVGDKPDGEVWRIELDTPRGSESRRIRTWMRATNAGTGPDQVAAVRGEGLSGGVGVAEAVRVAVLFADGVGGGSAAVPGAALARALVVGLAPGEAYRAAAQPAAGGCRVEVARDAAGTSKADPSGTVTFDTKACAAAR